MIVPIVSLCIVFLIFVLLILFLFFGNMLKRGENYHFFGMEQSDMTGRRGNKKYFRVIVYSYDKNVRKQKIGYQFTAGGMTFPRGCDEYILYDCDRSIGFPIEKVLLGEGDVIDVSTFNVATGEKIGSMSYTISADDMEDGDRLKGDTDQREDRIYIVDEKIVPRRHVNLNFGVRFVGFLRSHSPPSSQWPTHLTNVRIFSGDNMIATYSTDRLPQRPVKMPMGCVSWLGQKLRVEDQNGNPIGVGSLTIVDVDAQKILVIGYKEIGTSTS